MLSKDLINDVAVFIKDKVKTAEVVFDDDRVEEVSIMRKYVVDNLLKVNVNTTKGVGTIKDIRLKDANGKILISKPREKVKTTGYAIVSSFYIKIVEEEIDDPINIFEIKEGLDG
ncbi:hypothetical protein ES702_00972 [subsurface metagenome]